MNLLRHPLFFRLYRYLPQRQLNQLMGLLGKLPWPQALLRALIQRWVRRDGIDLEEVREEPWSTLEAFFLRRLVPGARPLGRGLIAPADGILVAAGEVEGGTLLQIKGQPYSLDALLHGDGRDPISLSLMRYERGAYATIFLTPDGYHYVHAPADAEVVDVRWLPGRFYPQNPDALVHIDGIYPRNERAVLRLRLRGRLDGVDVEGEELLLVFVGASLIGGVELTGWARQSWARRGEPTAIGCAVRRGDELGYFTFGSTVVLIAPRTLAPHLKALQVAVGQRLRQGQTLYRLASEVPAVSSQRR